MGFEFWITVITLSHYLLTGFNIINSANWLFLNDFFYPLDNDSIVNEYLIISKKSMRSLKRIIFQRKDKMDKILKT